MTPYSGHRCGGASVYVRHRLAPHREFLASRDGPCGGDMRRDFFGAGLGVAERPHILPISTSSVDWDASKSTVPPRSLEMGQPTSQALEAIAKVHHLEGRGWYRLRRIAAELAESAMTDDRVTDRLGGWHDSETLE